jgi:hypothetical protein
LSADVTVDTRVRDKEPLAATANPASAVTVR